MKRIIAALALLCLALPSRAVDVIFTFSDFTAQPSSVREMRLYTLDQGTNNGALVTKDRKIYTTSTLGAVTVTNIVGGTNWEYRCELVGPYITTTNWFVFPSTNGTVTAADYREATPRTVDLAAYTRTQADARFVRGITSVDQSVTITTNTTTGVIDLAAIGGGSGGGAFSADSNGDLMPSLTFTSDTLWELDANGDLQPL